MALVRCFLLVFLGFPLTCSTESYSQAGSTLIKITEGDIALPPTNGEHSALVQMDAVRNLGYIWQDRKVPYIITSSIDGRTAAQIKSVMEQYMNKTCIQFIDVSGNTASVRTYLSIEKLTGCWSYIGRVLEGKQQLSIGQGCEYDGTIIHELMHALGFFHEQSRSDRDDFVAIMWENIQAGRESNFNKQTSDTVQNFKTEYDYYSVMHYKKDAFSKNGLATIVPRKNVSIGQRVGFSNLDLQEINALYQCTKTGGGLSEWSEWSPCLGSEDNMYKERQRFCFETNRTMCKGVNERGLIFETKNVACSDPECVSEGHWSRWSMWTPCPCPTGNTRRTRTCTTPAPKCGGATCPGSNVEEKFCIAKGCPGPDDCDFEDAVQFTCHWHNIAGYRLQWVRRSGSTPSRSTGPTGDATDRFNGMGHYMYVEATPALQGQKARMCSKKFLGHAKKRLTFKYHSYVVPNTTLTVIWKNLAEGEKVLWTKSGLERNEWLIEALTITSAVNFVVCFEYQRGNSYRGDIAVDDLYFQDIGPDDCDFEDEPRFTCHWHNASGYILQWVRNTGSTPSRNTGPNGDATDGLNGKGHYLYVESSPPATQGQKARICSKRFLGHAKKRFNFKYHSYAVASTKLRVILLNATGEEKVLWNTNGLERNEWLNANLTITDGVNFMVCLEYERGYSYRGDIAVDDLYFEDLGYCGVHKPCKRNSLCTNLIGGNYTCNCSNDYIGRNCSEKISPCNSNPCHNNGTCFNIYSDLPPTFNCKCPDQYFGKACEYGPDDCDFESNSWITCHWHNITGYALEWIRNYGSTFSGGTGPTGDATNRLHGKGHYLYVESSSPAMQGQKARMCSKEFKGPAGKRFTFKYHSYAVASTKLRVILQNSAGGEKVLWNTNGLERNEWLNATLNITNSVNFVICFEYERGSSYQGDIAVDDLFFKDLGLPSTCPDGLASFTGFVPCNYKVPHIKSNPTVAVSHQNGRIVYICKYDVDPSAGAFNAEVSWYHGSSKKETYKENFQPWRGQASLQNREGSKAIIRLGTVIYCKIRGWYGNFQGIASKYYESNRLFAGISISPDTMHGRVTEGGLPLKINITSTVPVVCSRGHDCKVQVQLVHDTTEIFLTRCSVSLRNRSSTHTVEVHAKRDSIDDGNKIVTIKIAVVNDSNAMDWQNYLAIDDLKIEVIDVGTARCSSSGDPRLLTFDNLYYSHFQPGDHVFVKSLSRNFEVHVRTWQCGSVTCNCGIAVREGNDVIILDMCFDGIPRLRFASKKTPAEGTIVKRDPTGKSFVIKFPSGAFVRSDNFRWSGGGFANFVVQIPSDDFASTRGLCGTFDYKSNNEMLSKNGIYYDQRYYYGSTAPWGFSESWKIPVRQSLFYHRVAKGDCHQEVQKVYCDCKGKPGETNGVKCISQKKLSQPPEFQEIGWKEIRYGGLNCRRRMRRSTENIIILPEDNQAFDYVYDPKPLPNVTINWPTKSGKTEAQVGDYCNKTIKDSAPGKICAKISSFNFTSFLLQCIDDIKITDSYEFSSAAVRAMQDACEEIFLKNTSYWQRDPTNNGSLGPPKEMADTLCPSLCSGHGKCEKSKCICDTNYTSADCSIDERKGPTILSISGNRTCDVRNRSNCHLIKITGHDFIDSDTLSCRAVKVSAGGNQSTDEKTGRSYLLSFQEVLCDLGQHPVSSIGDPYSNRSFTHAIYELQISNDQRKFSKKKVPYIIYDSTCMECNINALKCSQKPNTCIINGYCFGDGEKYASDPCFVCKPSVSTTDFTSSCKIPKKETNSVALIVSTTVGSVVLIALIIVLVYLIRKKRNVKTAEGKQSNATKASFDNQAYASP